MFNMYRTRRTIGYKWPTLYLYRLRSARLPQGVVNAHRPLSRASSLSERCCLASACTPAQLHKGRSISSGPTNTTSVKEIASTSTPVLVEATSEAVVSHIWFKTDPIDRLFCYRAVQLQLQTDSSDQGHKTAVEPGSWSWFELVIFEDAHTDKPRLKDGKELVWRSHGNRTDPLDVKTSIARNFGVVFDRRQDLLDALEIGNVVGVRVCARYPGWVNNARAGRLLAKVLDEDLFTPMSWSLSSTQDTPEDIPDTIQDGVYTLVPTSACQVASLTHDQAQTIWFTTPVLDKDVISKIQDLQLFTQAHGNQGEDTTGVWTWFDLVILATPEATEPNVKDGRALVWRSHDITKDSSEHTEQTGKLFSLHQQDLLSFLQPGNVIGVRACARFPGWQLHGHSARLVVRISNIGPHRAPAKPVVDWNGVAQSNQKLQANLEVFLDAATPKGVEPAHSVETTLLGQELRSDWHYGAGGKPLRLLSLDGGGVRGISSLYVLKAVMNKITGDPNAKPCDYFDMIAGTSTGGLIALMLGRLRMSIDECIEAYNSLASKIFSAGLLNKIAGGVDTGARYSAEVLEQAVKDVIKKYSGSEDTPMRDPVDGCKVFVVACRADDLSNRIATHLRTYINGNVEKSWADYKIWEASRATSAAPTYFPRIKLGDYEYIDGGMGFNNHVLLLMGEAHLYYGFARPFGCLVTIGTGMAPNISLAPQGVELATNIVGTAVLLEGMATLITNAEHANKLAEPLNAVGTYYRFNVGKKIQEKRWVEKVEPDLFSKWFKGEKPEEIEHFTPENWAKVTIELDDYQHMPDFVRLTQEYLKTEAVATEVAVCAGKLPPKRASA